MDHPDPSKPGLREYKQMYIGKKPVKMKCTYCKGDITTNASSSPTVIGWIFVVLLLPVLLCWVPIASNCCSRTVHKCPMCKHTLGYG